MPDHRKHWIIIPIDITAFKQVISIDHKIPAHLKTCSGVLASVVPFLLSPQNYLPQLGELSLQFNNNRIHPLHMYVDYSANPANKRTLLDLRVKLLPNSNVTGYYRDLGFSASGGGKFQPYKVNIYLECYS